MGHVHNLSPKLHCGICARPSTCIWKEVYRGREIRFCNHCQTDGMLDRLKAEIRHIIAKAIDAAWEKSN